ncbi:unnamed protein product [Phytophthora fragariaefolia]|uniref:Unnamed protein product n=1 Tax=Phytophthora fragariaefolia TaxID=1490495 RepID=A0A9W7D7M3_9STRA|nr:unnamed protein product [Phytophthora fragariaefolia]
MEMETSDSEYIPSASPSEPDIGDAETSRTPPTQRISGKGKRSHQTTPDVRVRENAKVVNPHNWVAPHKKQQSEPLARALAPQFDEVAG